MLRCVSIAVCIVVICGMSLLASDDDFIVEKGVYSKQIKPLGTTVNDLVIIFYDRFDGENKSLCARTAKMKGKLKRKREIAPSIEFVCMHEWDAVWHPEANMFLVVYHWNGYLYSQVVNKKGKPKGGPVRLFRYDGEYMHLTWSGKKEFILSIYQDNNVALLRLDSKGKQTGDIRIMTNFKGGGACPAEALTLADACILVIYYWVDDDMSDIFLSGLIINDKLRLLKDKTLVDSMSDLYFYGAVYDEKADVMLMSWSEVIMQPRCRAFDSSLNPLTKVIDQQTGIMPLGWSHCTRSCLFSMMFLNTNFAPSDLNYGIYAMDFNPEKLKFLAKEKIERIPCHGMVYAKGYSREGSRILCWSLMKNPEGVFARIIR